VKRLIHTLSRTEPEKTDSRKFFNTLQDGKKEEPEQQEPGNCFSSIAQVDETQESIGYDRGKEICTDYAQDNNDDLFWSRCVHVRLLTLYPDKNSHRNHSGAFSLREDQTAAGIPIRLQMKNVIENMNAE
jgi:hypothetical protein